MASEIVSAFVLSGLCVLGFDPLCHRLGHIDRPGRRKRHQVPTPLSGGFAIAASLVVILPIRVPGRETLGLLVGIVILLLLGARDDRRHVPPVVRLLCQFVSVALGMVAIGGVDVSRVGPLFGGVNPELGAFSFVLTVFGTLTLINAINMIDGIDGLAAGFGLLVMCALLGESLTASPTQIAFLSVIIGAIGGFLLFNMHLPWQARARSFLGDAGSLMLGFVVSWFLIHNSQGASASIAPITAVWFVGLPLADLCCVMAMRLSRGRSPLRGDRQHFHHLLLRSGCTAGQTCVVWLCCAGCFMGIGALMQSFGVPIWQRLVGALAALTVYALWIRWAWRRLAARVLRNRSTDRLRARGRHRAGAQAKVSAPATRHRVKRRTDSP